MLAQADKARVKATTVAIGALARVLMTVFLGEAGGTPSASGIRFPAGPEGEKAVIML